MGVSADGQDKNDAFRKSLDLPFPLVGDPDGTILSAYKVRWPILGLAQRVTYVVGQDRKLLHAYRSELDAESHVAEACSILGRKA